MGLWDYNIIKIIVILTNFKNEKLKKIIYESESKKKN